MGLFSKPKKSFDPGPLQQLLEQGFQKKKGILDQAFNQTPQLSKQFETKRNALGQAFETGSNQRAQQFATQLQGVESPDFVRQQQAKARELAFRDVPTAQQNIREQLGATGGLNRGVAIRALSQPTLQASQNASDQGFQLQQEAAARDMQRRQVGIDTIFSTGQGAALEKLGIDRQTATVLLETGRADLIDRAMALAGLEEGRTQALIDIEQNRQADLNAREQAKNQQRAGLISGLGSIAGAGIGSFAGNPLMGASIGSSIGGQAGGLVGTGGASGFDLSKILALLASQQKGGGTSTGGSQFSGPGG